jgi:hypothetical protein
MLHSIKRQARGGVKKEAFAQGNYCTASPATDNTLINVAEE